MFPRGKCGLWKKEKINGKSGLFLPSCSKHKLVETLSLLWGTLLSSTQAAVQGLLQLLSLGDIQWATVQFPGNDSSYLNHDPSGWYFVPPLTPFMDWEKKRLLQSWAITEYWTLSLWVPRPGAQWLKFTELLAGCSCSTSFVECVVFRGKF